MTSAAAPPGATVPADATVPAEATVPTEAAIPAEPTMGKAVAPAAMIPVAVIPPMVPAVPTVCRALRRDPGRPRRGGSCSTLRSAPPLPASRAKASSVISGDETT